MLFLFNRKKREARRSARVSRPAAMRRPFQVELLEDRTLPSSVMHGAHAAIAPPQAEAYQVSEMKISTPAPTGPTLTINNVSKKEGIAIAFDVMEFPPCRLFAIKDPDGNQIGLHQRKAK